MKDTLQTILIPNDQVFLARSALAAIGQPNMFGVKLTKNNKIFWCSSGYISEAIKEECEKYGQVFSKDFYSVLSEEGYEQYQEDLQE